MAAESRKYDQSNGKPVEGSIYFNLTLEDFAQLFGTTVSDFSYDFWELIDQMDFRYQIISGDERDQILLDVLKKIDSGQLTVSGRERKDEWEKGWSGNLQRFIEKKYDISELVPAYVRTGETLRLNHNYINPCSPKFHLNFRTVFYHYLFKKYLEDFESIYDFGCGTGYTLVIMAQLFPEKKIYGLDWTNASKEFTNKIGEIYNYNITGHYFDMFSPDYSFKISDNSAVITVNSLEQLGRNYEPFLQFIFKKSPALCINSEPLLELYDENNLMDYVAIKYHKKRGYLENYLTRLRQLEADGRIEILKTQRIFFGILYHEGYSFVVWKPKR